MNLENTYQGLERIEKETQKALTTEIILGNEERIDELKKKLNVILKEKEFLYIAQKFLTNKIVLPCDLL